MIKFAIVTLLAIFFLLNSKSVFASSWYYPMDNISERATLKGFGILVNDAFYKGREELFPNKFYGYHAGQDLETLPQEKEDSVLVPFFAVSDGTITYIGNLSGYGGVILEKLSDGAHTALYGHVKLPANIRIGDAVKGGQLISYLGNSFSRETWGERKHLHFALHKGTNQYFHGHEQSLHILNSQWEDPIPYLKNKNAVVPGEKPTTTPPSKPTSSVRKNIGKPTFFETIFSFFSRLFKKL